MDTASDLLEDAVGGSSHACHVDVSVAVTFGQEAVLQKPTTLSDAVHPIKRILGHSYRRLTDEVIQPFCIGGIVAGKAMVTKQDVETDQCGPVVARVSTIHEVSIFDFGDWCMYAGGESKPVSLIQKFGDDDQGLKQAVGQLRRHLEDPNRRAPGSGVPLRPLYTMNLFRPDEMWNFGMDDMPGAVHRLQLHEGATDMFSSSRHHDRSQSG